MSTITSLPANESSGDGPARIEPDDIIIAPAELSLPIGGIITIPDDVLVTDPGAASEPMTQKRVLGLAVPIIGENFLQTMVGAIDTFMVAKLGAAAVAGVGTSVELVFFLISILSAVDVGATVLVSQAIGAKNPERANQLARQAVMWGIILSIPISILGFLGAPAVVSIFNTAPEVAEVAATYVRITAAFSVVLLLSFVCGAILRGAGDSKTPFKAAMLANVVNVIVAYGLIFGNFGLPELGVAGSAYAAAAGRAIGAAVMLTLMIGGKRVVSLAGRAGWAPNLQTAKELFRLGVPAALEQMLMSGGFTTMLAVVAMIGTAALAAQQIAFTALSLAFMPGFGFAIASTALVGQSIGARNIEHARQAQRIALRWGIVWMTAGGILYFVFASQVLTFFVNDTAVHDAGVSALHAISLSLPFWALWSVCGGALRGTGDTRTPMIVGTLAVWLAVAIAWVGVRHFDFGLGQVWMTFMVTAPLAGVVNMIFLNRRLALPIEQISASAASAPAH